VDYECLKLRNLPGCSGWWVGNVGDRRAEEAIGGDCIDALLVISGRL